MQWYGPEKPSRKMKKCTVTHLNQLSKQNRKQNLPSKAKRESVSKAKAKSKPKSKSTAPVLILNLDEADELEKRKQQKADHYQKIFGMNDTTD